jgi:hypothetical protein
MLQEVAITNQLDWLATVPGSEGQRHGLPKGFDKYLKVLLPLGIDRAVPIEQYSFRSNSIEAMNARAAFWNQYSIVQGQPLPERLERITYREVAKALDIPYDARFSAASISNAYGGWPPNLGTSDGLNEEFIQTISEVIGPATPTYYCGTVESGSYHWVDEFPADWLERGVLADLLQVYQRDTQFPEYIFGSRHTWCINHPEDADWVVIGCSSVVAVALVTCAKLECFVLE